MNTSHPASRTSLPIMICILILLAMVVPLLVFGSVGAMLMMVSYFLLACAAIAVGLLGYAWVLREHALWLQSLAKESANEKTPGVMPGV